MKFIFLYLAPKSVRIHVDCRGVLFPPVAGRKSEALSEKVGEMAGRAETELSCDRFYRISAVDQERFGSLQLQFGYVTFERDAAILSKDPTHIAVRVICAGYYILYGATQKIHLCEILHQSAHPDRVDGIFHIGKSRIT